MWQRFTERARRAIYAAQEEATRLGEDHVGTEHLLLGLIRDGESVAARILDRLGVPLERIRDDVERQVAVPHGNAGQQMQLTPRAKRVIDLAYEAARSLNNNYIGTEHLLLGLIDEGGGLAARVLVKLGATRERTRREVYAMQEGEGAAAGEAATPVSVDHVSPPPGGREGPPDAAMAGSTWEWFTERARRVVYFAQEEAARLALKYVDTEHFLLGLVRENDTVAARILVRLEVEPGQLRAEVERNLTRGQGEIGQDMELTPRGKRVIELAYHAARRLNNNHLGTEHLLLGLIEEGDGLAARVLIKLGATPERTLAEVRAIQELQPGQERTLAEVRAAQEIPPPHDKPPRTATSLYQRLWDQATRLRGARQSDAPSKDASTENAALDLLREYCRTGGESLQRFGVRNSVRAATELARELCGDLKGLPAIEDLTREQAWALLSLARLLKRTLAMEKTAHDSLLRGKTLAMLFEKPSLRTRVSFEVGMFQLGGHALYLQPSDISMGKRESVADVARNLDRMVDGIMARVFAHATIRELAEYSSVPVINGLCDREHPCQALADFLTVWERKGQVEGQRIAFIGDGNNVAHSLMLLGAKLGAHVVVATPEGYAPDAEIVAAAAEEAAQTGGSISVTHDPREACRDADFLYTDVWASMGQEAEAAERAKIFAPFQVNAELCALAKPDFLFLHCLPAHRGEEVTAEVIDGPHGVVFDQAENRLHAQKAVMAILLW